MYGKFIDFCSYLKVFGEFIVIYGQLFNLTFLILYKKNNAYTISVKSFILLNCCI